MAVSMEDIPGLLAFNNYETLMSRIHIFKTTSQILEDSFFMSRETLRLLVNEHAELHASPGKISPSVSTNWLLVSMVGIHNWGPKSNSEKSPLARKSICHEFNKACDIIHAEPTALMFPATRKPRDFPRRPALPLEAIAGIQLVHRYLHFKAGMPMAKDHFISELRL